MQLFSEQKKQRKRKPETRKTENHIFTPYLLTVLQHTQLKTPAKFSSNAIISFEFVFLLFVLFNNSSVILRNAYLTQTM